MAAVADRDALTFPLLRQLAGSEAETKKATTFISPLSLRGALVMLACGATLEHDVHNELCRLLGFDPAEESDKLDKLSRFHDLLASGDVEGVSVRIAHALFSRASGEKAEEYAKRMQAALGAHCAEMPDSPDVINSWVADATEGEIDSIIEDDIDPLDWAYLLSAVLFRGVWALKFKRSDTSDSYFTCADGSNVRVPMMRMKGKQLRYGEGEFGQVVRLPYGTDDSKFAAVVVLPPAGVALADYVDTLSDESWTEMMSAMHHRQVKDLGLPRFTAEYGPEDMIASLSALGLAAVFSPSDGLQRLAPGVVDAFVLSILHKTRVKVDEEGTVAAAVTSVRLSREAAPPGGRRMIVDRPFIMAITYASNVLFIGSFGAVQPEE
eukprot:PLAT12491.3.p1 GENE.PLAT12491.3~~PLAT12491.3.p1  ORF type:complete len:380 (-),score=110.62 PLAT12491.3:223-1362(-)